MQGTTTGKGAASGWAKVVIGLVTFWAVATLGLIALGMATHTPIGRALADGWWVYAAGTLVIIATAAARPRRNDLLP